MELYYQEIQHPSDQTILFLHEGLGCTAMWKDFPQKVCDQLQLNGIVYDRAGYGKSKGDLTHRTASYLHEAAEELHEFVEFLNLDQVILYGHSDGGSIALIYAAKYPHKVKAIITEAAHSYNDHITISGVQRARPLLELGKMDGLQKYHGTKYKEVFWSWNNIWLDESFKNWDIRNELKFVTCPNLIIQGQDDQFATLEQVETLKQLTSGKTHTFTPVNCAHAPHKEQTDLVIQELIKFFNEFN